MQATSTTPQSSRSIWDKLVCVKWIVRFISSIFKALRYYHQDGYLPQLPQHLRTTSWPIESYLWHEWWRYRKAVSSHSSLLSKTMNRKACMSRWNLCSCLSWSVTCGIISRGVITLECLFGVLLSKTESILIFIHCLSTMFSHNYLWSFWKDKSY